MDIIYEISLALLCLIYIPGFIIATALLLEYFKSIFRQNKKLERAGKGLFIIDSCLVWTNLIILYLVTV